MIPDGFLKIGHRGAMAYEPENTIKSIKRGIELGANMIEMDIRLTSDKKLVVFHDERLERTTNGTGLIKDFSFEQIKRLHCDKNQPIPSLEDTIAILEKKKIGANIEIKDTGTAKVLLKEIKGYNIAPLIVSSFYHSEIKKIKELEPKIKTSALLVGLPVNIFKILKDSKADGLDLCKDFICEDLVKKAKSKDIPLIAWKINDVNEMEKFTKWGVTGIITDKPDLFSKMEAI